MPTLLISIGGLEVAAGAALVVFALRGFGLSHASLGVVLFVWGWLTFGLGGLMDRLIVRERR